MPNKNNSTDQHNDTKSQSRRRMQIGISGAVIAISLIIIFMPKKTATDTSASPVAPMFKKQGECTIMNREDKPIVSIDI